MRMGWQETYSFEQTLEEFDVLVHGVHLGLQFHLVGISCIHILKEDPAIHSHLTCHPVGDTQISPAAWLETLSSPRWLKRKSVGTAEGTAPPPIMRTSSMIRNMVVPQKGCCTERTSEPSSMGAESPWCWLFPVNLLVIPSPGHCGPLVISAPSHLGTDGKAMVASLARQLPLTFFSSTNSFSAAVRRLISSSYLWEGQGSQLTSFTQGRP